jgi:hypothetical protein
MDIKRNQFGRCGERFELAQDMGKWWAVLSMGVRFRVP